MSDHYTENVTLFLYVRSHRVNMWRQLQNKKHKGLIIIIIIIIIIICEQLAPTKYVKRHDGLAKIIHQKLAEAAKLIDDKSPYYKYTPANVLENENFKLYWNRSILTGKQYLLINLTNFYE
jgi:CDP-diacylglycerol pyrophosphatase